MTAKASDLLGKKEILNNFLASKDTVLSAFSFVSLFAWKDFFDFEFKSIDGNLCVFARDRLGCFMYLPPLGKAVSGRTIDACFEHMYAQNNGKGVSRIDNVPEQDLALFDKDVFSFFEKSGEYIYRREDVAFYKGNAYKSQRSLVNRFVKSYRHEFLPFEPGMKDECLGLYGAWAAQKAKTHDDSVYRQMLKDNRLVHEAVLGHAEEAGVTGRVVLIDGEIKAYTFGFALNPKIFCVLFEIADLSFKGLAAYVFKEFCGDACIRPFTFINAMDDFGMNNVKRTKLSFKPVELAASYAVSKK